MGVEPLATKISSFLGFHSPTKEGPGSDADKWAPNLVSMFASGLSQNAYKITSAASFMLQPFQQSFGSGSLNPSSVTSGYSSANSNGAPTIIVNVSGNITKNEQELGNIVSKAIWQQAKMQGKFA